MQQFPESAQDMTVLPSTSPSEARSQERPENAGQPAIQEQPPSFFYTQEQDDAPPDLHLPQADELEEPLPPRTPFVLPFQPSAGMPPITQRKAQGTQATQGTFSSPPPPPSRPSLRLIKILLIVAAILLTVLGGGFLVLAGPAPSPNQLQKAKPASGGMLGLPPTMTHPPTHAAPPTSKQPSKQGMTRPTPQPGQENPSSSQEISGKGGSSSGMISPLPSLQHLRQLGWIQAGLTVGDALEAQRTAAAFTDHEMSFDYRALGTPAYPGGTLTSATFILTPGGKIRFARYDKRMINTILSRHIRTQQLIQNALILQNTLVQFQHVLIGNQMQQFAWVTVSFELHQSRLNPTTGQREEDLERDPATGQVRTHQLTMVLLRVSPDLQGPTAPMGGTGWLVNTYRLDTHTLPVIATQPTL